MAKQMTVRNLKRFAKQWAEYEDEMQEELLEFNEDDARYIRGVLFVSSPPMDKYREMTDVM